MSTVPIRVLIADAHPIVLEGLRSVLSQHAGIQVVGEAQDGVETIDKTVHLDPDVVLLDLKLPRVDGLTVLRSIQTRAPRSKVMFFASVGEQRRVCGGHEARLLRHPGEGCSHHFDREKYPKGL